MEQQLGDLVEEALPARCAETGREEPGAEMMVAQGLTNRQIAERHVVGDRTVESHVRSALGKLGLRSRFQLADWAAEQGLAATTG